VAVRLTRYVWRVPSLKHGLRCLPTLREYDGRVCRSKADETDRLPETHCVQGSAAPSSSDQISNSFLPFAGGSMAASSQPAHGQR
jgi:hypothetical protein